MQQESDPTISWNWTQGAMRGKLELDDDIQEWAESNWVRTIHLFDKSLPYGGTTICYKPQICDNTGYPRGKFAQVSVAYCNPKDRYNRKLGQRLALENLYDGKCILLPVYTNNNPVVVLRDFFDSMTPSLTW
jgi:hypothetical protein